MVKRRGSEITFNAEFLAFADHYGFRPLPHWPGEPHQKGLVERPVGYVKGNFWAGRRFANLGDVERQGQRWRDRVANVRDHGTLHERPVDRFVLEQRYLFPLPKDPYPLEELLFAKVSRWGYVHVDANEYSVPLVLAGKRLQIRLSPTQVRVFHQGRRVAQHPRCLGRHQVITDPQHQQKPWRLRRWKPRPIEKPVPGLEFPSKANVVVMQRDLAVYDALLAEESHE